LEYLEDTIKYIYNTNKENVSSFNIIEADEILNKTKKTNKLVHNGTNTEYLTKLNIRPEPEPEPEPKPEPKKDPEQPPYIFRPAIKNIEEKKIVEKVENEYHINVHIITQKNYHMAFKTGKAAGRPSEKKTYDEEFVIKSKRYTDALKIVGEEIDLKQKVRR
jgi:hypothetical protein